MRVVLVFSDAICCDTTPRFYLFTCRHSRAGGVLWIARCLIRALKSLRTPLPIQSHLWLFWSDFRESGELCAVLWSFASICEFCRRMKGRDGNDEGGRTQVLCRARVCTAVQRDPWANRTAALPATQPSSQPAGLISPSLAPACWHRQPLSPTQAAGRISASWPQLLTFVAGLADLSQMATL